MTKAATPTTAKTANKAATASSTPRKTQGCSTLSFCRY